MTEDHFVREVKQFIANAKNSKARPVSYLARQPRFALVHRGIRLPQTEMGVLSFPLHCRHKLQSLDVSVYGSLRMYVNRVLDAWVTNPPGHTVTIYDFTDVVNSSLHLAASSGNIKQVSRFPFNKYIFHDECLGAYVIHRCTPPVAAAQQ